MANNIAFQAMGNTVALTSTSGVQSNVATITALTPCQQYLLTNQDLSNIAFVQISSSSSFNIAAPNATSSSFVIPVSPFNEKVVTAIQVSATSNTYARIISSGTSTLYITPGEGL